MAKYLHILTNFNVWKIQLKKVHIFFHYIFICCIAIVLIMTQYCVCAGWDICVSADGSLHSCGVSYVPGLLRGARHHAHIWWISLPSVCTSRSQKIRCSHWSTAPIEIWRFYLTSFLLSHRSETAQYNGGAYAGKETKPLLPCLLAVPVTHACAGEEKKTGHFGILYIS